MTRDSGAGLVGRKDLGSLHRGERRRDLVVLEDDLAVRETWVRSATQVR